MLSLWLERMEWISAGIFFQQKYEKTCLFHFRPFFLGQTLQI